MRERTPSADDTPKRAPPAPPREAASADVAGSKTSSGAVEISRVSKFSPVTTASSTASTASSPSCVDARMVASTHNLDDLGVNVNNDRQQQQEKHGGYAYRSAQTAQDKRSRLSNVINNLRKKVPDAKNGDTSKKEEDDRNSVERNLETLEKYVMTVLNGVIKDEEDDDREIVRKKEAEKVKEPETVTVDQEDEDSKGPAAQFEPSKPNESRTEAAVFLSGQSEKVESKEPGLEQQKMCGRTEDSPGYEDTNDLGQKGSQGSQFDVVGKDREAFRREPLIEEEKYKIGKSEEKSVQEMTRSDSLEARSLGTIIMERLSENQSDEKEDNREFVPDNVELRNICRDLLNDLLNGINQLIDGNTQEKEDVTRVENSIEESTECKSQEFSMTSLHCSLPLDKVASVLQNCQANDLSVTHSPSPLTSTSQGSKSPCKPSSPTVRHCLCLYCDRKFMSISLRQRHTERVHQQGGGRRPERNSRKSSQNCQYCSDKCAESLEGLFQHMVGNHADKYHGCLQCSTRYVTREALLGHMSENHSTSVDRNFQTQEKIKEPSPCKELDNQSPRPEVLGPKESDYEHRTESILLKPMLSAKDNFSNPGSPEFDSSFYSSVSCNIRENLLHHLDGKLQSSSTVTSISSSIIDAKSQQQQQQQQQQSFYEHNVSQIQFPIDISLTAATPVYSKEYSNKEYENNSEYAQKPGKSNRSHPRRVSFEKYNFPRKYDGKEQWTCSIKDLSNFDISTQLFLRKKQQGLKERLNLNRLHQIPVLGPSETTEIVQDDRNIDSRNLDETGRAVEVPSTKNNVEQTVCCEASKTVEKKCEVSEAVSVQGTEFNAEFGSFLRLRKWDEKASAEAAKKQEAVYAELTGEWSRPRVYICGACTSKHATLKEMEDHKVIAHPNVWCSHFEFSGDQRELYKHLFLPGKDVPTAKARVANLAEKVCTKCSKNCNTLPELHRHMLECGGDQAWLLGLFGNGKKKCKWRPFGSRSRRRRQRGMKRNIQNSQTPRVNTPKEKLPTGPRVRPSDRESIQKMLANLPPKRATRKVLQESSLRTQGRLRNVQTRTRPRMVVGDNSSASRMSRNKAALRNKLLKNAKSIQRNRCRIDNISAVIESVVRNCAPEDKKSDVEKNEGAVKSNFEKETKENSAEESSFAKEDGILDEKGNRGKVVRGPRVLGKKRNVKTKEGTLKNSDQMRKAGTLKAKSKIALKSLAETKIEFFDETVKALKGFKVSPKGVEKEEEWDGSEGSSSETKSPSLSMKGKCSTQTTPKRKRPVDPVASLNASIKAKSQLRTQDGKFARNPNKESFSPQKSSPEMRSPVSPRIMLKSRANAGSPELSVTRSKLRAVSRNRNGEQFPKRPTRLSSDSDKMPMLEPAVQVSSDGDEFAETSVNDLPILSPATPASSPEKVLHGRSLVSKNLTFDLKDYSRKVEKNQLTEGKNECYSMVQEEERDQRQGKGRRPKNEVKNIDKSFENITTKTDSFKETTKTFVKEKFKRKSAPARILNLDEKKAAVKGQEELRLRKETKQKKEEGKLETRSNSKVKLGKMIDEDTPIKIQNVPFEVKKLIGSDSREDLLTKLVLTSRVTNSKRCLRQPMTKAGFEQSKNKLLIDLGLEKAKFDSGSTSDASTKKEKFDARRKSMRKTNRKVLEGGNKIRDAVNEVKTAIRRRRSSSLSSDTKISSSDGQSKIEIEATMQSSDKRQTRGSLITFNEAELQCEVSDLSLKKNPTAKRRGRVKYNNDNSHKKNIEFSQVISAEHLNKDCSVEQSKSNIDTTVIDTTKDKREKTEKDSLKYPDSTGVNDSVKLYLNLNHLRIETSNSIDSGKENSLETPAPVQKLKVGRPRKSWGPKKEKTAKRSLNNVIGILTEGINIPVDTQQSVLNVQTNIDNSNSDESVENKPEQLDSDSSKLENTDANRKSSENNTLDVTRNSDTLVEIIVPVQKDSEENAKKSAVPDISTNDESLENRRVQNSKVDPTSKEQSPATDIILDLSRRKPKGKGSFLEKIVSKIAKQKDALLEGEVGSLLDTAADELTSILDEVGPNFPESPEKKNKDGRLGSEKEFTNKTSDITFLIPKNLDHSLKIEAENEENRFVLRKEESFDKVIKHNENLIDEDEPLSKLAGKSKKANGNSILEIEKEGFTGESTISEHVNPTESITQEVRLSIDENIVGSAGSNTSEQEGKELVQNDEDIKSKRRSKRRSLDGSSPKKNKRKSIQQTEQKSPQNQISKGFHLSDIINLIEKSKQVPSSKENTENELSTLNVSLEKVQCGKRKSLNDKDETKDSLENRAIVDISRAEDPSKSTKKLKVDSEEKAQINKEDYIHDNSGIDNISENLSETRSSLSLRITGKRKSYVETLDQYPEIESSVKESSKRRSLEEEKTCQPPEEDVISKIDPTEAKEFSVCEMMSEDNRETRRRSSRAKYVIQPKYDEKMHQETKNDSDLCIGNIVGTEDHELSVINSSEHCGSSVQEPLKPPITLLDTAEVPKISKENINLENIKNLGENNEIQNSSVTCVKEPGKADEPPVVPKIPKKRGRKKKCVINDQTQINTNTQYPSFDQATHQLPPRRSLRTNKISEESEGRNKNSSEPVNVPATSPSSEHFKVPEVTEVLQHTKKRTYKRRSTTDEHSDTPNNCPAIESEITRTGNADVNDKSLMEKEDPSEHFYKKDFSAGRKRLSKSSNKDQQDLQRSSSSGSIDLPRPNRTRSAKRKQLSSEDLSGQESLRQRAESVDNLSETSCVSESSYFRRKRFSKKKKGLQVPLDEVQTDTSVTDSESVDTEKSTDRRQSLKRRAKKNISFLEDLLFLVDGFDIPMDIQDCISREDTAENNASQETKQKQATVENNVVAENFSTEVSSQAPKDEEPSREQKEAVVEDIKKTAVDKERVEEETEEEREAATVVIAEEAEEEDEEEEVGVEEERKGEEDNEVDEEEEDDEDEDEDEEDEEEEDEDDDEEEKNVGRVDEKADDSLSQAQDDFQTPKKRSAGNYVVIHKKTGEILIVEKRKKLTKEAARFFCNVCTTSFTRKSSLKKHNQSQSHLTQVIKCKKDKSSVESIESTEDTSNASQNDISSDENAADDKTDISAELKDGQMEPSPSEVVNKTDLESVQNDSCYTVSIEQSSLIGPQNNQQHTLEDELLDEEICKITENMSHDEYVLTDHVSPAPDSTSTPIKLEIKKVEEVGKKRKHEKKKEKVKKKVLDEVPINLSSPELETPTDNTLVSVLGTNMSIKIGKSSHLIASKNNLKDKNVLEDIQEPSAELKMDVLAVKENESHETSLDHVMQVNQDVDMEKVEHGTVYKFNTEKKTENPSKTNLENASERLSLKFTINKCSIEPCKNVEPKSHKSYEVNYSSSLMEDAHKNSELFNKENNYSKLESERDDSGSSWNLSKTITKEDKRNSENVEELNAFKVQSIEEDNVEVLDKLIGQQTHGTEMKNKMENVMKISRHGKSKKGRVKKYFAETDIGVGYNKVSKKSPKFKGNQNKLIIAEVANNLESMRDESSNKYSEKLECLSPDLPTENNVESTGHVASSKKLENGVESNELKIIKDTSAKTSDEFGSNEVSQKNTDSLDDKTEPLLLAEDDETSSSSSLADKPLAQILLEREQLLGQSKKRRCSSNILKDSNQGRRSENRSETKKINSKPTLKYDADDNLLVNNELNANPKSNEHTELQFASGDECEPDRMRITEEFDKCSKIASESDNSETIPSTKDTSSGKGSYSIRTISNSKNSNSIDRRSSSKKISKSHRYSKKDNHKASKGKRTCIRNKIADLTSDSDDSENEDKVESQNKNKIVKTVFGRVFGGEKVDKVKEVLNDWVSKSEDDSETSKADCRESIENRNSKRHQSVSSSTSSSFKRRAGKKSRKNSSSDRTIERNSIVENQQEQPPGKNTKSKIGSNNKTKHEAETSNGYFQILPSNKCRPSKKRAEELISRTFENDILETVGDENPKLLKNKETNYGLRNQVKPDLTVKDSGYGSFNYDEDSLKVVSLENVIEADHKMINRRKSSASRKSRSKTDDEDWSELIIDKKPLKNNKQSGDEENSFMEDLSERESATNRLLADPESSQSCTSLAPSSVRNRSPSMDRNSQTTKDSDIDEDEDVDEDMDDRRISPLFICGTSRSSIGSSTHSENEEEDENMGSHEAAGRKRSSSEFSGEKIVIRSPSSVHKGEVVTIAPTDAIEDNALDVPQEIETAKPRQGKVLNFDEELFVECCSRLKATTENELRGAKKIKLDHNEGYNKKDEQQQGFRGPRDRWRDVESQNSLGSLLESVNQLLGEEMYSTRERDYPKRSSRNLRSEHSSRSASPDMSRVTDNLGYEDSLDVAFEHNNKLRDKIQQRMRESENLIASTFGQKASNEVLPDVRPCTNNEHEILGNSYSHLQDQRHLSIANTSNGYNDNQHVRSLQEEQTNGKINLDSCGIKGKMNSSLGGLLDKALSNLLHNNEKHDQNGSTPMKVLAELACARAPTSTTGDTASHEANQPLKISPLNKNSLLESKSTALAKDLPKKSRNPIKELFERKREINERKQQEKSKTDVVPKELNVHRQRKTKKIKKHQDFPLIRRNELGGLAERKKRRDGFERKEEFRSDRIKDVYEFDEEESQIESNLGSVLSYRSKPGYEVSCLKTKEVDVAGLMSKAIGDSLENGKTGDALSTRLESMIDQKFKELEKFAPKTKGALKAFQGEDQQLQVTGPMDEFVERKQTKAKKTVEPTLKHSKLRKRSRNHKKKTRNAWYENDSSDEYRTAVKTEGVGVGISKSQRTCSKGKQNIFAELYTSSESEYEDANGVDYESRRQRRVKTMKKVIEVENIQQTQELINKYSSENEGHVDNWGNSDLKSDTTKHDSDNKKSESEMSDHPLVIDERKDTDEQRNSDDETENQYERNFEMDDLYREDSSIVDSDVEDPINTEQQNVQQDSLPKIPLMPQEKVDSKVDYIQENELIPLEEALDLLDQVDNETTLETRYGNRNSKPVEHINTIARPEPEKETINCDQRVVYVKSPTPVDEQEEEPDNDVLTLPEKLSSNEKPQKESENLPLHVFLSRKVQESKKRKEQQLKKMQEEQERILMDFQSTRRQRKCAIGKQGLLAEISSSDDELSPRDRRSHDKSDHDKPRKQKRESKEKRKERYIEKKHEQMIAKEQKAIEEEILREVGKKKESLAQNSTETHLECNDTKDSAENIESPNNKIAVEPTQKKKHQSKEKQKKQHRSEEDPYPKNMKEEHSDTENNCNKSTVEEIENIQESTVKLKKHPKISAKVKKLPKADAKMTYSNKKNKNLNTDKKSKAESKNSKDKERRSSSGRRDSDDEELKTTKSWNKVEEGVGVAIGRRKRAAANQLYYWSSSSDEEELLEVVPTVEEEEDDRQEQHGWIVGDSHKRMITMLAMEKQLKEKRRRSEDEFEPGKAKSKKHRNSTS